MKTLVELIGDLDRLFDDKAKDGLEPVYAQIDGKLVPIVDVEMRLQGNRRILIMKGEVQ